MNRCLVARTVELRQRLAAEPLHGDTIANYQGLRSLALKAALRGDFSVPLCLCGWFAKKFINHRDTEAQRRASPTEF